MIAVVDSGGANVGSVMYALERLGITSVFTSDAEIIASASHVILPGVGAASAAMKSLQEKNLIETLQNLKQPVLGICLGMQILFSHSKEGDVDCLDIISGNVEKFDLSGGPVPHMGWNQVLQEKKSPLFMGIPDNSFFYFVHSYYAPLSAATLGASDYGARFSSVVGRDNFFGCQFHPERSGAMGAKIIENFVGL